MIRHVPSVDNSGQAEVWIPEKHKDRLHLMVKGTYNNTRSIASIQFNKHRLGVLIDVLTAFYNEVEGDLKERTIAIPPGAIVTVDGVCIHND